MRKNFKYNLIGLALLFVGIVSCDTATQEVSPIVSPDDSYPVVTFTLETPGATFSELDTIVYTISINKPINRSLTFRATQTGGTADDEDYTVENATILPYTTEAQLKIILLEGWEGEADETAEFEIGLTSLADKYLVAPESPHSTDLSFTIKNNNYAIEIIDLTVAMPKDGEVWIAFNGDVTYVEGKTITFHDRYYSSVSPDQVVSGAENIIVSGDHIQVLHEDFWEWTTIEMTVEAGAFVDAVGNVNEETLILFPIPFNMYSYAGSYEWTSDDGFGPYVEVIDIEVADEDNYVLSMPDGDGLVDNIELEFDLDNYKVTMKDLRSDTYLVYDVWYSPPRYYLASSAAYSDPDVLEASQLSLRNYGQGFGVFDETTFEYEFVYSVYGDLVKGDGTYGTYGTLWYWEMYYVPDAGVTKTTSSANLPAERKFRILDEFTTRNGEKAYNVELVK